MLQGGREHMQATHQITQQQRGKPSLTLELLQTGIPSRVSCISAIHPIFYECSCLPEKLDGFSILNVPSRQTWRDFFFNI